MGGELFDVIVDKGSFLEDDAREVVHSILTAILFCHERHVVHRDIKVYRLGFQGLNFVAREYALWQPRVRNSERRQVNRFWPCPLSTSWYDITPYH